MTDSQISIPFVDDPAMVLSGINDIFEVVDAILRGEMFIAIQVVGQALSGLGGLSQPEPADVSGLDAQERQVLDLLRQAHSNRDIAVSIATSEETLKRYMTNLMIMLRFPGGADAPIPPEPGAPPPPTA